MLVLLILQTILISMRIETRTETHSKTRKRKIFENILGSTSNDSKAKVREYFENFDDQEKQNLPILLFLNNFGNANAFKHEEESLQ